MTDAQIALAVAAVLVAVFGLALSGLKRRRPQDDEDQLRAVQTRLVAVESGLVAVDGRGVRLETEMHDTRHDVRNIRMAMGALPSARDVSDIKVKVAELTGEVKGVTSTITSLHASVGRVENFLMQASADAIVGVRAKGGAET